MEIGQKVKIQISNDSDYDLSDYDHGVIRYDGEIGTLIEIAGHGLYALYCVKFADGTRIDFAEHDLRAIP